jgi:hypothetical protein
VHDRDEHDGHRLAQVQGAAQVRGSCPSRALPADGRGTHAKLCAGVRSGLLDLLSVVVRAACLV